MNDNLTLYEQGKPLAREGLSATLDGMKEIMLAAFDRGADVAFDQILSHGLTREMSRTYAEGVKFVASGDCSFMFKTVEKA